MKTRLLSAVLTPEEIPVRFVVTATLARLIPHAKRARTTRRDRQHDPFRHDRQGDLPPPRRAERRPDRQFMRSPGTLASA
jgi:hypothetical protein